MCFIWGEMKTGAALIKHYTGQLPGGFFKKVAYRAAQRFGPSDPRDQQDYEADLFPWKFWGFLLLVLGFLAHAVGAILEGLKR